MVRESLQQTEGEAGLSSSYSFTTPLKVLYSQTAPLREVFPGKESGELTLQVYFNDKSVFPLTFL